MIRYAALAVLFLAAWTPTAQADFSQEIGMCEFGGNHPDIRIIACTRNINSGRFTGRNLAIAFTNRGLAYKNKGLWDRAIADYDEAIRLNSDLAETFSNRGTAYYSRIPQIDRNFTDLGRLFWYKSQHLVTILAARSWPTQWVKGKRGF